MIDNLSVPSEFTISGETFRFTNFAQLQGLTCNTEKLLKEEANSLGAGTSEETLTRIEQLARQLSDCVHAQEAWLERHADALRREEEALKADIQSLNVSQPIDAQEAIDAGKP